MENDACEFSHYHLLGSHHLLGSGLYETMDTLNLNAFTV